MAKSQIASASGFLTREYSARAEPTTRKNNHTSNHTMKVITKEKIAYVLMGHEHNFTSLICTFLHRKDNYTGSKV